MGSKQGREDGDGRMMAEVFANLGERLACDRLWTGLLRDVTEGGRGAHLGVFVEPYLRFVLDGSKTVESRFSVNRCPPWGRVERGDLLLLKASGGPVVGVCKITYVWSYRLRPQTWRALRKEFAESLCAQDPSFWASRARAAYATLMRVSDVRRVSAVACPKRDRRGWVVLADGMTLRFLGDNRENGR